jgi:hypothetical protein
MGKSWPLPKPRRQPADLAAIGGVNQDPGMTPAQSAAVAAAERQARASGKPVTVGALTTGTTTVSASPRGRLVLTEHVVPVRVRRGSSWVPVSTTLRRNADGSWSPVAVPGDAVRFSGGGPGQPLATISADKTALSMWWPGRLPSPVVSGSTATFGDVLPGVDLAVTATSAQTGGFSEVLIVRSAAAAANPALARLQLGVTTRGVQLASAGGGRLVASAVGVPDSYVAAAPRMWDSSWVDVSAGGGLVRSAFAAARSVGADLAPAGPRSSPAGPGGGARLAPVAARVQGGGRTLSLVPDRALLASRSTVWPVYIDPDFQAQPLTADGGTQAFIPLQSDCPKALNYNNPSYKATPVGFDNFGNGIAGPDAGTCATNSTDYSDFRVVVPSAIWGANLSSAAVNVTEVYSSVCPVAGQTGTSADVTLSWVGNFGTGTDWNNQPGVIPGQTNNGQDTQSFAADPASCDGTAAASQTTGTTVGQSFNVMDAMTKAAKQRWPNFAFRLWEQNNTNDALHKQIADQGNFAPELQIVYNDTPDVPSMEKAGPNNDGTNGAGCDSTVPVSGQPDTNPPGIGAISGSGPFLQANFIDDDGDPVQGIFRYWKLEDSPGSNTPLSTAILPKGGVSTDVAIPASFYSGLTPGQVIAWDVHATDGTFSSDWSQTCYFAAFPKSPASPTVSAPMPGRNCPGGVITVGCQVTFTITAASGDPVTFFGWRLDRLPPTANTPANETLAAAGSPPSATLTVTVPSPGPHNLWVFGSDNGSNPSGTTNGAPQGSGDSTFTAAGDPKVTCGTFADALANTCSAPSSPNTMISRTASSSTVDCGTTTGDGNGGNLDATQLEQAGWQPGPGTQVTVDGATFALPQFGACQPDNVLAANQTIGMGNAKGNAVVFLAASTHASSRTTALTGAPDAGKLHVDATAPGVPAGVGVTGGGCTAATEADANLAGCEVAGGTITYVQSPSCSTPPSSYDLTVPDWVTGPGDIAALTIAKSDLASGSANDSPSVYAFAVPVANPGCQIASVTLPDVSNSVRVQLSSSSPIYNPAALHIFGIAVRNTTTATPQAGGGSAAAPSGQSWTGGWAAPAEVAAGPSGGWGNQTLRILTQVSVTGSQVRIRLTDPGFLSGDGDAPLQIGHATIALQSSAGGPALAAAPVSLTFSNSQLATIPAGGDIYSDPASFPVTAGENLLVSLYLANPAGSLPFLPQHGWNDSTGMQWVSAPAASGASGDNSTDTTGTPFTASSWSINTDILSGVDVTTAQTAAEPGGTPTVAVLGDNLTDVNYNGFNANAISFPITRLPGGLASALGGRFGVVAAGINSNQASADSALSSGLGGISAIARLDRDVLAEPDIGTVIIDEGLQDLLHGASQQQIEDAYGALLTELGGFGVNIVIATITPCSSYASTAANDSCSTTAEGIRTTVNGDLLTGTTVAFPNCAADFSGQVAGGPVSTTNPALTLQSGDDAGDGINFTQAGYTALTSAAQAQPCGFAGNLLPPPV